MLVDIANAVGGYLHDVFIGGMDWGILVGYVAQAMFAMRFCGAVGRVRARRQERGPDRVLGHFHRRRVDAARLCALPERSGVHPRAGLWFVRVCAQPAIRHPQPQRHGGGIGHIAACGVSD